MYFNIWRIFYIKNKGYVKTQIFSSIFWSSSMFVSELNAIKFTYVIKNQYGEQILLSTHKGYWVNKFLGLLFSDLQNHEYFLSLLYIDCSTFFNYRNIYIK